MELVLVIVAGLALWFAYTKGHAAGRQMMADIRDRGDKKMEEALNTALLDLTVEDVQFMFSLTRERYPNNQVPTQEEFNRVVKGELELRSKRIHECYEGMINPAKMEIVMARIEKNGKWPPSSPV